VLWKANCTVRGCLIANKRVGATMGSAVAFILGKRVFRRMVARLAERYPVFATIDAVRNFDRLSRSCTHMSPAGIVGVWLEVDYFVEDLAVGALQCDELCNGAHVSRCVHVHVGICNWHDTADITVHLCGTSLIEFDVSCAIMRARVCVLVCCNRALWRRI
jgi:hypothetical protein